MPKLFRVLFHANEDDPRPINWPVKFPHWTTGYGEGYSTKVSYADSEKYIKDNWPEATNISMTEVDKIEFSDRFPKPDWFDEK